MSEEIIRYAMQIQLPAIQQNPMSETAAAQSAEKTGSKPANSFFAEIDQILHRDKDNEPDPATEKSSEDPTATAGNAPMSVLQGVDALPVNGTAAIADAAASIDAAASSDAADAATLQETAAGSIAELYPRIAAGNGNIEEWQSARNFSDAKPETAPPQQDSAAGELSKEMQLLQDSNPLRENASKKPDEIPFSISEQQNSRILQSALRRELMKSNPEENPIDMPLSRTIADTFPAMSAPKSDSNASSGSLEFAGRIVISKDSDAQNANAAVAAALENTETISTAALDTMAAGDGGADQSAPRDASIAWSVLQRRFGAEGLNSANPQASAAMRPAARGPAAMGPEAEGKQGLFSVDLFSGNARGVNPGNSMGASADTAAAAQSRDFILQVAEQIHFQIREGKSGIRIQLKPENLGRLEIKAETAGSGIIARITAESDSVKNYLENNLHVLRQALRDQGLKVDQIDITVNDGSSSFSGHGAHSGHGAQFGRNGSGQSGREYQGMSDSPISTGMNSLEEVSMDTMAMMAINPNIHFYTIA